MILKGAETSVGRGENEAANMVLKSIKHIAVVWGAAWAACARPTPVPLLQKSFRLTGHCGFRFHDKEKEHTEAKPNQITEYVGSAKCHRGASS